MIRKTLFAALVATTAIAAAAPASAQTSFNVPAGPLAAALDSFSRQSGKAIIFRSAEVRSLRSPGVQGALEPQRALDAILRGTGFVGRTDASGNYAIVRMLGRASVTKTSAASGEAPAGSAAAEFGSAETQAADPEIVVTAQKREERLREVPVPVTVLPAAPLAESGKVRLQDYINQVPGVSLVLAGNGNAPTVVIRGISTGNATNPTVSTVVDEIVYGFTITNGATPSVPDIDPGDLARIEVLRGPQGTLYGASSIGGLLKFVTIDPSTNGFSGRLQAGLASVHHGGMGFNLRGSVNVPITTTVALRASGSFVRTPGYVDNLRTGNRDVDRNDSKGGRISFLWRPSNSFSLRLGAFLQDANTDGLAQVDRSKTGLTQSMMRGTGSFGRKTRVYTATINGDFGNANLVSATGYSKDQYISNIDLGAIAGNFYPPLAQSNFGVSGASQPFSINTDKFSQELRLTVPVGNTLEWLLGAYYTHERSRQFVDAQANEPITGTKVGSLFTIYQPLQFDEYAAFSNITVRVNELLDIQFGGRVSHNRQAFSVQRSGPLVPLFFSNITTVPEKQSSGTPFTYLMTPRFKLSKDVMLYARVASGYRAGGPNINCGNSGVPCSYGADTTRNYEIGLKGSVLDRLLSFDLSGYTIDWRDIQVAVRPVGTSFGYTDNAGRARSRGIEAQLELRPTSGTSISGWLTYNDAKLTEISPATTIGAKVGQRLPYSSKWSGNVSLDQTFPLSGHWKGSVGGTGSFVGDRLGSFRAAGREIYPSHTRFDVRAGVKSDLWSLNLFINNMTDRRGILRGGLDTFGPTYVSYITPRTFGLSLTRLFN